MPEATRVKTVPVSEFGLPDEHIRRLSQAVFGLQNGQANNHFFATLTAGATQTAVRALNATIQSVAMLSPMSTSAAVAFASGTVWSEGKAGEIVIHHDSDPATDRLFGVVLHG